jgi:AcrR family transcriptional regulator
MPTLPARERFTMAELSTRTGVPAATVHHYLRLGLIPPPKRVAPNRFLYDDRHVQALRLIRVLRERRRLPLAVIRRVLPDLLGLDQDQAFRPEMWDRVVGTHAARGSRRRPAARLVDAAIEAFSRGGYAEVNVDEICRAARMAKGSFYRHFRSKEDLFLAAAEGAAAQVVEEVKRAVESGPLPLEQAAAVVARSIEPRLPLFMELFARAVQRRPGYAGAAGRLFSGLAHGIGEAQGAEDPLWSGARVLQLATVTVFRRALEPSPLSAIGAEPAAQA